MSSLFDENGEVPWRGNLVNADRGAMVAERPPSDWCRGKRMAILSRLGERPGEWVSTDELKEITHRFSASIFELRQAGHNIIGRVRSDGFGYEWRWESFEPRTAVAPSEQEAYYRTSHWQAIRKIRLQFDDWRCAMCGSGEDLAVHHWRYDLFAENNTDLMTLCRNCHSRVHDEFAIHFPKHVSHAVKQRLIEAAAGIGPQ